MYNYTFLHIVKESGILGPHLQPYAILRLDHKQQPVGILGPSKLKSSWDFPETAISRELRTLQPYGILRPTLTVRT
jgi:hypothetical protein